MVYLTAVIIAALLLVSAVIYALGDVLSEFRTSFMYITLGIIIFIIGAAIYLSFAIPSLADAPLFESNNTPKAFVTQDDIIGLDLVEE